MAKRSPGEDFSSPGHTSLTFAGQIDVSRIYRCRGVFFCEDDAVACSSGLTALDPGATIKFWDDLVVSELPSSTVEVSCRIQGWNAPVFRSGFEPLNLLLL